LDFIKKFVEICYNKISGMGGPYGRRLAIPLIGGGIMDCNLIILLLILIIFYKTIKK
jgi:hypothetical protein